MKEYKRKVRKIWKSELNGSNKVTAHNTLAVPVITPTISILNWTKKEICDIDIATRRMLSYMGDLHHRADVNRLYVSRKQGGRALTSIEDVYMARNIILADHPLENKETSRFIAKVTEHEEDKILRLGNEFKIELGLSSEKKSTPDVIRSKLKHQHLEMWKNKPMHSYIFKKVEANEEINVEASHNWLITGLSSHIEGYITSLQEQEIATKATVKRRTKDSKIPSQCRLCGKQEETVLHVLGSCSALSSNLYISASHDNIARVLVHEIAKIEKPKKQRRSFPAVSHTTTQEIWWDRPVSTVNKVKRNRTDVIIWDKEQKNAPSSIFVPP